VNPNGSDQQPGFYTVDELVALFGGRRRRSAIYEDIRTGRIPSLRLGRRIFIARGVVERLIAGEQEVIAR
jgi:hypothetical protein